MTTTTTTEIDWAGAEEIASRLGMRTRRLVADREVDAVWRWASEMGRQHSGPAAASYRELATLIAPDREQQLDDLQATRVTGEVLGALAGMARERGLTTVAELGSVTPADVRRYLRRAREEPPAPEPAEPTGDDQEEQGDGDD